LRAERFPMQYRRLLKFRLTPDAMMISVMSG
jgi:hypothetical protein